MPDPTDPRAVADDPSGIVQQMTDGGDQALKPCPFCGQPAEWEKGEYEDGRPWNYIACSSCEAMGPDTARDMLSWPQAIAAWNRRATEADLRAEVERLRSALIPFASAWRIARAGGLTSMVVLGQLARNEVAAVSFLRASAALYPETDGGQDA